MTLSKAIEILIVLLSDNPHCLSGDTLDAVTLAFEALQRVKFERQRTNVYYLRPLPGETGRD